MAYLYSLSDVFSETTVHLDTLGSEVFTQKAFTSSAVETSATRLYQAGKISVSVRPDDQASLTVPTSAAHLSPNWKPLTFLP